MNNQLLYRNMHSKKHSEIFRLFQTKNADTGTVWNEQILMPVLTVWIKTGYQLLEQKKFQNKSKNIDEVYQSEFFRCIMFLLYRVTFFRNICANSLYIRKSCTIFFYEKSCKLAVQNISPEMLKHQCSGLKLTTLW